MSARLIPRSLAGSSTAVPWLICFLLTGMLLGQSWGRWQSATPLMAGSIGDSADPGARAADPHGSPLDEATLFRQLDQNYEQHFAQIDATFARVSESIAPSVVHIVARKVRQRAGRPARAVEETGSGVIVRSPEMPGCYVLTNHHVVAEAQAAQIVITLDDERQLRPVRTWSDPQSDVAVLELGRNDLPSARLGDSHQLRVGHWVLAVGSPFGLDHSVSQGIVSARGRYEPDLGDEGVLNQDFLQTDAAINPGNSGGPLVNMRGEVVGINTAIASNGGGSEGVGFSIPINLAGWIMDSLIRQGRVVRGAMGVRLDDLSPESAQQLGLDRPRGALVTEVYARAPAARAGIRDGDVILRFNQIVIQDLNHLINTVSMADIGRQADVLLWRAGQQLMLPVVIADRSVVLEEDPASEVGSSTLPPSANEDGMIHSQRRPVR